MDETKTIQLLTCKQDTSWVPVPDRYEFNPQGRLPWLQKLLFKILRKLGAENSFDKAVTYKHTVVNTDNILEALMKNQREVMMLYHKQAKYVVMGPRQFSQLAVQSPKLMQMMRFRFTAQIGLNRQILPLGLEVVIVPWIDGFFVMPDLNDERN